METTIVSTCTLNQWVLDFESNADRIIESIREAKDLHNSKLRLGPELELPGYCSEDHFYEQDTLYHCWEQLKRVLQFTQNPPYDDIICCIGMPVSNRGILYNCGIFILAGQILLIRPKLQLCDDKEYRESRWFTAWHSWNKVIDFVLPTDISEQTGQRLVPFGNALLRTQDNYLIGSETCEELWCPIPTSTPLLTGGAHIILNQSGSHFSLRKLKYRKDLIRNATVKTGGLYLYSNLRGCDGCRLYFDGTSMIALNGQFLQISEQFSFKEVDVTSAKVDLSQINNYRTNFLKWNKNLEADKINQIKIDHFSLIVPDIQPDETLEEFKDYTPQEQIAFSTSCFMWDYLRRSRQQGFFLPLSGGCDSSSTISIIGVMCQNIIEAHKNYEGFNKNVIQKDILRLCGHIPSDGKQLAGIILKTAYLGTQNSSDDTRRRARNLASEVGATHYEVQIDKICSSFINVFARLSNSPMPQFKSRGGSWTEDLALQNIQARSRMIISFFFAQLLGSNLGNFLVLGSANLEEGLTGYMTKYDCSSADINPIGGISKEDLKRFCLWAAENRGFFTLREIIQAPPTAELQPLDSTHIQTDEDDLGMTYREMSLFGIYRKIHHCGPLFMLKRMIAYDELDKETAKQKIKRFFQLYIKNRHKMTIVTPAIHVEDYSADDNRFDMRPVIYKKNWDFQFDEMEKV